MHTMNQADRKQIQTLPRQVVLSGRDEELPRRIPLRAGPLSAVYEHGDLRYIRLGDREIIRRIYVAVRDRNWGTVPIALSDVQIEIDDQAFRIQYVARHQRNEIDFLWKSMIIGSTDGEIRFEMDGHARSTFLRNRIGFCVLHPPRECAGQPCVVIHDDGTREQGVFPRLIMPDSPFREMAGIAHEVVPGVWADLRFNGDVFEMEDQRNWTDASFKTFCTPLRLPYPVEISAGSDVKQSVTLQLMGDAPPSNIADQAQPVAVVVDAHATSAMPALGVQVASDGTTLDAHEVKRLNALRLAHLRVDLDLADLAFADTLASAVRDAQALDVPLEIAVHLANDTEAELAALRAALKYLRPRVARWLVFQAAEKSTNAGWVVRARPTLQAYAPDVPIGSGTNVYFTELNRGRPDLTQGDGPDFLCYSINPQVHAFDNASLVENLAAQAMTVDSARAFSGGRPIVISPVTLRPRFNAVATGPEAQTAEDALPFAVDERQMSLFGAAWTLGSIKYLAESGVSSVTLYETTGWRGVMERAEGSRLPDQFRSIPGAVFPLYHVLHALGGGGDIVGCASSEPLRIDGLAVRTGTLLRVLLANMSADEQDVRLHVNGQEARVRIMDETNAEQAMRDPEAWTATPGEMHPIADGVLPLRLLPYAVAFVEIER
jgi:D-apionolactonase